MKAVVVGAGSIGKRHVRNLRQLGVSRLAICDPDPAGRDAIGREAGIDERYGELGDVALKEGDVVFICSPNHLHAEQAVYAAARGCHLFIEKPLAHTLDHLEELGRLVHRQSLVTLVGCNMRFYPCVATLKRLLGEGRIGRVLSFRVEAGIYLPNWRPHLDYRKNYGAHRAQGGGVILDMIHEIDYARWLFGDPVEVFSVSEKVSSLDIDTEDVGEITLRYDGMIGNIHLDYLSHRYTRMVHAVGERGDLFWEWHAKGVECFEARIQEHAFFPLPQGYDLNQMYLDEMTYFLDHVTSRRETFFSVSEARRVLEIALAAKQSHDERRPVALAAVPSHAVSLGQGSDS